MKRFSLFIGMITMVLSASAVNIDNLFSGDSYNFEGGTQGNWYGWGDVYQAPTIVSPGFNSEYCMKLVPTEVVSDAWKAQAACEFAALDQGETYHLKFMAKGKGTIQIFYQNADYSKQMYQSVFTLTDEWQEFTETMIPTADDFIKVLFNFGTATECYIDNVEFGLEKKPIAAGDYYFFNLESGLFLAGGNSWGTQASLKETGYPIGVAQVGEDGYTLDTYTTNGGDSHYFGTNGYIDAAPTTWTFSKVGKYTDDETGRVFPVYTFSNGGKYVGNLDGNLVTAELTDGDAEAAKWVLMQKSDLLAKIDNATFNNQADATFLLSVPNFGRNQYQPGGGSPWTVAGNCTNSNLSGGNNINNCAESWHSTFDIYQQVNVPNGFYIITMQGFWRQDAEDATAPYFYANEKKQTIAKMTGTENSMSDASVSFSADLYYQKPIVVEVTDGILRVGVKNESNTSIWVIWDNFQMSYCPVEPVLTLANKEIGANGAIVPLTVEIGSKATVYGKFDAAAAAKALGVANLKKTYQFAIDATTAYSLEDVVYVDETYYRNINGDVCEEGVAVLNVGVGTDGTIFVTPLAAPKASNPIMNVYSVFATKDAAYLVTVQVSFVDPAGDGATAIENVKSNIEGGIIYDLTGRKVSSVRAGQIYIVNGKKVILK